MTFFFGENERKDKDKVHSHMKSAFNFYVVYNYNHSPDHFAFFLEHTREFSADCASLLTPGRCLGGSSQASQLYEGHLHS